MLVSFLLVQCLFFAGFFPSCFSFTFQSTWNLICLASLGRFSHVLNNPNICLPSFVYLYSFSVATTVVLAKEFKRESCRCWCLLCWWSVFFCLVFPNIFSFVFHSMWNLVCLASLGVFKGDVHMC